MPTLTGPAAVPSRRGVVHDDAHAGRPLRVCHVSMHLKTGGLERLLVELARRHDPADVEPLFVALQDGGRPAEDIAAAGRTVHVLDMAGAGKPATLRRLRRLIADADVDVVHTHNTYAHFYGSIAARLAGVRPIVNTQHGRGCGSGWKARWQFRIANRLASQVVGVSEDSAALCRAQDPRARDRITTIWNGIDIERFEYRGPQLAPRLIAVGRLSPEKDFATLLRAVRLAADRVPELSLQLVGDGAERPALQRLADELQIAGRVEFLGERNDVPRLLGTAGCYVSSSRTEGISLTLLEAMAVGLPVIATRVGGNAEVIQDGTSGRLVDAESPDQLAEAIVSLCGEMDLWPAMGRLGRERVERCFSIEPMVRAYERLYRDLVPSRSERSDRP